jgi:hypothetical protein
VILRKEGTSRQHPHTGIGAGELHAQCLGARPRNGALGGIYPPSSPLQASIGGICQAALLSILGCVKKSSVRNG